MLEGLRRRRNRLIAGALLLLSVAVYAITSSAAPSLPVPVPLVNVHTESGGLVKDTLIPIGGVPVPIDVDNGTLLGLLSPDVDVAVNLISLPDLPNVLVPNIVISRDPLAVIRHTPSPPLKISLTVVIEDASTLSRLATIDYGYETPFGAKIPPKVTATLLGPITSGFIDPLKARIDAPGYGGALKFNIRARTTSIDDLFQLKFDPLPDSINVVEDPRDDGLDFTYDHTGPTPDVKLDATADLKDVGSGEVKHIGAVIERLPNHIQASYTQKSTGTILEYLSGSDLGKPDIEATYRDTLGNGTIVNDGDARISGLPSHIKATIASRSNPDGTTDIDGVDFGVLEGGQIDAVDFEFKNFLANPGNVPEYNLGSEQFVAMASKRQAGGSSAYRATGHLLAVRGGSFSRTGTQHDKLAVSTDLGNGDLPLRGIVDLDNRGAPAADDPKRTKVDATIDPLPRKIDLTYQPSSDTDPTDIVYDFPVAPSKPVNADTLALIAKGPSSTCGDDRVICAQAAVDNVPLHLEAKLPGTKGSDFSVSHSGPATGTGRPNVRATVDVGPDSSETPAKPRTWVQAALNGVPPEVRGRLDTHTGELTAAEFHGCDWNFAATNPGCVHAQNAIHAVDFTVRDQPDRVGLPPRPDTAKQFVTLISRQKAPEPKHLEVKGHVDEVRNIAFHQLDLVPNDNKTDGVLGAQVELGGTHSPGNPIPFDVAVDTVSDALGPKPDNAPAPVIGEDAKKVSVHVDDLPPRFGACVRSGSEGAAPDLTGKPEAGDALLSPCETAKVTTSGDEPAATPLSANYTATDIDGVTPFNTHIDAHVTSTAPDTGDFDFLSHSPFPVTSDLDVHVDKVPASMHVDVISPVTPDKTANPPVKGRRLQVRYTASDKIDSIKFALQQRRATSICSDPRPNRKALCLSGTLANLPAGGDASPTVVTFNPDDSVGDITIDTADSTPKLSLNDLSLSKVSPEAGATPIVVTGAITDLPAHMTGKLQSLPVDGGELEPTAENPSPTLAQQFDSCYDGVDNNGDDWFDLSDKKCKKSLARLEFDACPGSGSCSGVGKIDITATNALVGDPVPHVPPPPPATSGHPDPATPSDGFDFVQSGDFFRAHALIRNFQDLAYSRLDPATNKPSAATTLGAGLGNGSPLRAYLNRNIGTEAQKIDAVITNPPSKLALCMRDKTDDANLSAAADASYCTAKDANGDGANDAASSAIQLFAIPNGTAPDIDVRSLELSKGGGAELLTGHAFVGGLASQVDILSGDNVTVEGHQAGQPGPADVANHVDFSLSNYRNPGSLLAFPWQPILAGAIDPATDTRNGGNYLKFIKDEKGRFTAEGSIPHVKQVGMAKAPCTADNDTPAPSRYVNGHAPDYKCVTANIASHQPLGLTVRTIDADQSTLAVEDGLISSVPDSLAVTLAKAPAVDADSPRCHDNLNTDSSGNVHCLPPMIALSAPHGSGPQGTLEARLQTGKKDDLQELATVTPDDVLSRRLEYGQAPKDWGNYPSGSQQGQPITGARVSVGINATTQDPAIQAGLRVKIAKYLDLDPFLSLSCTSQVSTPLVGTSQCSESSDNVNSDHNFGYKAQNILFRLTESEDHPYGNPPASDPYLGRVALMINTIGTDDPQDQMVLTGMPEQADDKDPVNPDGTGVGADSHYAENLPDDGDESQFGFRAPGHLDAAVYLRSDYNAQDGGPDQTAYTQLDGRVNAPLTAAFRINEHHERNPAQTQPSIFDLQKESANRDRDHVPTTQITLRNEPGSDGTENYSQPTFRLRAELHKGFQDDSNDATRFNTSWKRLFTCESQYTAIICGIIPDGAQSRYLDIQVNARPKPSDPPARTIDVVGGPFGAKNNVEMRAFQNVADPGPKGPVAHFTPVAATRLTNFNIGFGVGASIGIVGADIKFAVRGDLILGLAGHQVSDLRLGHNALGLQMKSVGGASRAASDMLGVGSIGVTLHLFWHSVTLQVQSGEDTQHVSFSDCDGLGTSVDSLDVSDGDSDKVALGILPSFSLASLLSAPAQVIGGLLGQFRIGCFFGTSDSALVSDDNFVGAIARDPAPTFDVPGHEVPGQKPQAPAVVTPPTDNTPAFHPPADFGVPSDGHVLCGSHKFKNVVIDGQLDVGKTGETDALGTPCDGTLSIDASSVDVTSNGKIVADQIISGGAGKPGSGLGGGAGHFGGGGVSGGGGAAGFPYAAPAPPSDPSQPMPGDNGSEGAAGSDSVAGGLGGGTIRIATDRFINDGTITARGGKGSDATVETGGACKTGAGGGSGGAIEITANQLEGGSATADPAALDASGGAGGDGGFGGGGGSGGRVVVNAVAIDNTLAATKGLGGGAGTGFCDDTADPADQNPRAVGGDGADGDTSGGDRVPLASTVRLHDPSTPDYVRDVPHLDAVAIAADATKPVEFNICRKTKHFSDATAFGPGTDPTQTTDVDVLRATSECDNGIVVNDPVPGTHRYEVNDYIPPNVPDGVSGFFVFAVQPSCPAGYSYIPAHPNAQPPTDPDCQKTNPKGLIFHETPTLVPQDPLPAVSTARFGLDTVKPQITSVDLDGKSGCPRDSQCLNTAVGNATIHAKDVDGPNATTTDDSSGVAQVTCHNLVPNGSGLLIGGPFGDCNALPSKIELAEGLNYVEPFVYDRAGNRNDPNDPNDPAPPLKKWFVDTHKPDTPHLSLSFNTVDSHNGWRNVQPSVQVIVHDQGPSSGFGDDAIEVRADEGKLECQLTTPPATDDGTTDVSETCNTGLVNLDEGTHTYTAIVKDRSGLVSDASDPLESKLDTKPPSSDIFVGPKTPDGAIGSGWYKSHPFVAFAAADGPGGSGVDPADDTDAHPVGAGIHVNIDNGGWEVYDPTKSYVLGEGTHTVCWYAIDVAGNREDADPNTSGDQDHCKNDIKVDGVAPVVTDPIEPSSPNGNNGYYVSKPVITPDGDDVVPSPGTTISGIDRVEYQVDDGDWTPKAPITVQEGVHTIRVRAFDKAGNAADVHERTVRVDLTKPTAALYGYPPNPNGQGWFRQPRVDLVAARDERDGSGIDSATYLRDGGSHAYIGPFTILQGPSHTASATPKDRAGNLGAATPTQTSSIDTLAPFANPSPTAASTLTLLKNLLGSLLPALAPTTLAYTTGDDLSTRVKVTVNVFDQFENRVKTIPVNGPFTGGYSATGAGSVTWNGTNDAGKGVLPGVYHYRVTAVDQAGNSVSGPESLTFLVVVGLLPL